MEEVKKNEKKDCCSENKCCDDKDSCCDDKKSCCEDKKCCFSACKHCPAFHKVFKVILAVIIVFALLRIGAEFGSRHSYNDSYRFGADDKFNGRGIMMRGERDAYLNDEIQGGCPMMQKVDSKQGGCQALNNNSGAQGGCPMLEAQKAAVTNPVTPTTTVK